MTQLKRKQVVELIIRSSCKICRMVKIKLLQFAEDNNNWKLIIVDLDKGDTPQTAKQAVITPSTWIDGKLVQVGNFDVPALLNKYCQK